MNFTITVSGLGTLFEDLGLLYTRLEDDTEAMRRIAEFGREQTFLGFDMQGRFGTWDRLSQATEDKRVKLGFDADNILIRTGETRESFVGDGNSSTVLIVENHRATWGNSREDFSYHDKGSNHEPMRQILGHTEIDIEMYHWLYRYFLFEAGGKK